MNWLSPSFWLALLIALIIGLGVGYAAGHSQASNACVARESKAHQEADDKFQREVENGKRHAADALEWQRKADSYYRQWQERLNNEKDSTLSECKTQSGTPDLLLSGIWLSLYNAAWLPELDQGDPGGAAYSLVEAGGVTPREVLQNVGINAKACASDRKRLDELIDHLNEVSIHN
jgi:uncharacterized membrane-anchored protein YhcB (DUF1043 family)